MEAVAAGTREAVESWLPHRDQALLIDGFDYFPSTNGTQPFLVAKYTVPYGSWWTKGHFPGYPIMPGTMVLECAAQAGALLAMLVSGESIMPIHARDDEVRYKQPVFPGDELIVRVILLGQKRQFWELSCEVKKSNGDEVLSAKITGLAQKRDVG